MGTDGERRGGTEGKGRTDMARHGGVRESEKLDSGGKKKVTSGQKMNRERRISHKIKANAEKRCSKYREEEGEQRPGMVGLILYTAIAG